MVNARPPISPTDPDAGFKADAGGRLNILLTEDRDRPEEHWTRQFPRLMEPLGIQAHLAASAREALELADQVTFHAALVDLATPKDRPGLSAAAPSPAGRTDAGLWLVQVLQRRAQRLPVVVINSRATQKQAARLMNDALRLGAFSVVNRPTDPRPLLAVIQRLLDRHHRGQWPSPPTD